VREETGNQSYGPNAGISDTQIVSFFNDALNFIELGINATHARKFGAETFIDLVAGQEKYDLPDDFLDSGGVISVEYCNGDPNGTDPQWIQLYEITDLERARGLRSSTPEAYAVVNKQLWIKPIPSVAKTDALRVNYVKRLSRFSTRRGKIDVATLDTGNRTITALEVIPSSVTDPNEYNLNEYISVVDADGNIKMKAIKIDGSLNTSTGAVPVRSDFVYESGETIAVNNYVVFGKNASTHQLDLDESVESFLRAYAAYKIMRMDSNTDSVEQAAELGSMRDMILLSYSKPNENLILVPEV
jgi:hypothetical protein